MFLRISCAIKAKHKPLLLLDNYTASSLMLSLLCVVSIFWNGLHACVLDMSRKWHGDEALERRKGAREWERSDNATEKKMIEYSADVGLQSARVRNPVGEARDTQRHANCYQRHAIGLKVFTPWLLLPCPYWSSDLIYEAKVRKSLCRSTLSPHQILLGWIDLLILKIQPAVWQQTHTYYPYIALG